MSASNQDNRLASDQLPATATETTQGAPTPAPVANNTSTQALSGTPTLQNLVAGINAINVSPPQSKTTKGAQPVSSPPSTTPAASTSSTKQSKGKTPARSADVCASPSIRPPSPPDSSASGSSTASTTTCTSSSSSSSIPHPPAPRPPSPIRKKGRYNIFDPSLLLQEACRRIQEASADDEPPSPPMFVPGGSTLDASGSNFNMVDDTPKYSLIRDNIGNLTEARLRKHIIKNDLPMPDSIVIIGKRLIMTYLDREEYLIALAHNWRYGTVFNPTDFDPTKDYTAFWRHIYNICDMKEEDFGRIAASFALIGAEILSMKFSRNGTMLIVYFKTTLDWVTAATFNGSNGCILVPGTKLSEEILTLIPVLALSRTNQPNITRLYIRNIPVGTNEPRLLARLRLAARAGGFEEHKVLFAAPYHVRNSSKLARHGFFFVDNEELARFFVTSPVETQQGTMTISYPNDEDDDYGTGNNNNNNNYNNNSRNNGNGNGKRKRDH